MASDPKFGQEPPTNDDGSYKDVLAQFGHFYLHPDGQTLENVKDGTTYNLANIGSGGGGAFEDTDGDGIAELQKEHETHQGGDSRDIGGLSYSPTEVVAADSPYTTQGESVLYVDTTNGAVEIVLNSNDANNGHTVSVYDIGENAQSNNITISTEGTETINPGAQSSITISMNGGYTELINRAGNWFADRREQKDVVETGIAAFTNETLVNATRGTSTSSTSANTYVNMFDGESQDSRNEFNSSAQFIPDRSGTYEITVGIDIRGNTVAGDTINIRVRDIDAGSTVKNNFLDAIGSANPFALTIPPLELTAGTTYEIQVTNQDSSFTVESGNDTVGSIKRVIAE